MSFNNVIDQDRPKEILSRAIFQNRVAHAYLFKGPEGVGKEAMAFEFAKAIFCSAGNKPCGSCRHCTRLNHFTHPDFIFLFPMPKNVTDDDHRRILNSIMREPYFRLKPWAGPVIGIERIRELRRVCNLKPFEGKRIILIAEADKMTAEASNSLLKILEEPPPFTHIILTTANVNRLLKTIISRSQAIDFGLISDQKIQQALEDKGVENARAQLLARMCQGNYTRALEWLETNVEQRRDLAVELIRKCLRDQFEHIRFVKELLERNEKQELRDILRLLLVWFRDALVVSNEPHKGKEQVINIDKFDTLIKFVNTFKEIKYELAFSEIENSIEMLDGNIQINLLFIVLLLKLQKVFVFK
ncbi:DNA polymerase III subunit delta' [candidate division KSB1 bacterium]|nr:DNA polymerase III subunit delta' [candidate division KSB1 bacterium]